MLVGRPPGVWVVGRTARYTVFAPWPERQVGHLVTVSLVTGGLPRVAHCADNGLLGRLVEVRRVNLHDPRGFRNPSFDFALFAR